LATAILSLLNIFADDLCCFQSKTDIVQMSFYVAIGVTTPDSSAAINPEEFYYGVNTIFEEYNKNDNFLTYLVDGDQHCFTPSSVYYTAGKCIVPLSALCLLLEFSTWYCSVAITLLPNGLPYFWLHWCLDAMGPKDDGKTNSGPMLSDWTGECKHGTLFTCPQ
jgi:hypothetical protein